MEYLSLAPRLDVSRQLNRTLEIGRTDKMKGDREKRRHFGFGTAPALIL